MSGHSARAISNLRPNALILAPVTTAKVAKGLALNYGVYPTVVKEYDSTDEIVNVLQGKSAENPYGSKNEKSISK